MNIAIAGSATAEASYANPGATAPVAAPSPPPPAPPAVGHAEAGNMQQDDTQAVDAAIKAATDAAQRNATSVEFAKDMSTGRMVVRVVDTETQQVLRQMPSEEMIALGQAIDGTRGTMIDFKA
jgi:flagellar protein FlaG